MVPSSRQLRVGCQGRYLEDANDTPFWYLGDTAWELFHRLDRDEADRYLTKRAAQGFTVIQAVVLAEADGLVDPNPYGHVPLQDRDPGQPVEGYFEHVDYIVAKAAELGLFIGMLPTWGKYWDLFDPQSARQYGRFLGERYREAPVIWILGGDRTIERDEQRAMLDAMAAGLTEGDGGVHLKTFHPLGPGQSSLQLNDAPWLDFHMSQTSHAARDHDSGLFIAHDLALTPARPALDGEPRYEGIPVGFYWRDWNRHDRFDDFDVRQAAYWNVMAGACGHTYGNNNIWQMWQPGRQARIGANVPWFEALDHPGAYQMGHLRRLLESRPFTKLAPGDEFVVDAPRHGGAKVRGIAAEDGSYAYVYTPRGEPFTVDKQVIRSPRVRELWFDPRYGTTSHIHTSDRWGFQTYTPPTRGRGCDWLLVLEGDDA